MKEFRTLTLAKNLFLEIQKTKLPYFAKNQLERSALSIVLNLAEGAARFSKKERSRFYEIALGSYRETAIMIELYRINRLDTQVDVLGRHLTKLIAACDRPT